MLTLDSWIEVDSLSEPILKVIASTLKDLLKWSRFSGMQQLRSVLVQNLTTDEEMLAYELSDGLRGTREVAKMTGIGSNATVARMWKKWSKIGIVEPSEKVLGRFQRICSLEEVGLTVPQLPQQTKPVSDRTEEEQGESNDDLHTAISTDTQEGKRSG